ncbi:hypothetical protein FNAPI_5815 [Fusarium napiforme]|uniref:F-box domain-containing protein n=1 Tax=Fusarium napiforme TaxID=42672 RepID=A0A8H5JK62_9HYPO|nr:hypothetical protein FNAPI_5815 [Fusarium napiforme]
MRRRLHGEEPWDAGNVWAINRKECWMFLAPEKKQRMRMPVIDLEGYMDPSSFCTHHLSFEAFKFLCNSMEGVEIDSDEGIMPQSTQSTLQPLQSQAGLELLPAELLGAIFELLKIEEFMALALCSQSLWSHAVMWVKEPISEDMERESEQTGRRSEIETTRASIWFKKSVASYEKVPFPYDCLYEEAFLKQLGGAAIPEKLHESMKACLPRLSLEPGSSWLLRNLTDQEYVRTEAVVTSDDEATISLPGRQWLTLDILLLWLISWKGDYKRNRRKAWSWEQLETFIGFTDRDLSDASRDPSYGPMYFEFWPIWIGPWAGHRLDVVTEKSLDNDWKDRTQNITRLAPKMLRILYGNSLAAQEEEGDYWEEALRQGGDHWGFRQSSPFLSEDLDLDRNKPTERLSRIR